MADDATAEVRRQVEELGRRYVDLVYQAAVRQMGGEGRGAEDVTQAVFLLAMRKAKTGGLPEEGRMAGWLQNVTRYAVKEALRNENARRRHEEKAAAGRGEAAEPEVDVAEVRRVLDQALSKLSEIDREVVVRRYLRGEAVGEVAVAVGLTENTVSQRIRRAVEKLRKVLSRRGVIVPATTLAGVMIAECAKAAPAGVAGASGGANVAAVSIAKGAAVMMKVTKLKVMAVAVCVLLMMGVGVGVIVKIAVGTDATVAVAAQGDAASTAPSPPLAAKGGEGVDAPALVREVREKEAWIETAQSVYIKATETRNISKQQLANTHQLNVERLAREKDALAQAAAEKRSLPPLSDGHWPEVFALELAFDNHRTYELDEQQDRFVIFDGSRSLGHHRRPAMVIRRDLNAAGQTVSNGPVTRVEATEDPAQDYYEGTEGSWSSNNPMGPLFWPIAAPHPTWFAAQINAEPMTSLPLAVVGSVRKGETLAPDGHTVEFPPPNAEDFNYLRTEKFRGIDCYVLLLSGAYLRYSIGVNDHLLHRVERGGGGAPWKIYRAEAQKQGTVITDNQSFNKWWDTLDENEQQRLSRSVGNAAYTTATAWLEWWLLDYVEVKPGKWFPKTQGHAFNENHQFDGARWVDDDEHRFQAYSTEIHVAEVRVDDPLPASLFAHMEPPEGAEFHEVIDGVVVSYKYKANLSAEEKTALAAKVKERERQSREDAIRKWEQGKMP